MQFPILSQFHDLLAAEWQQLKLAWLKVVLSVNSSLTQLYWNRGKMIVPGSALVHQPAGLISSLPAVEEFENELKKRTIQCPSSPHNNAIH